MCKHKTFLVCVYKYDLTGRNTKRRISNKCGKMLWHSLNTYNQQIMFSSRVQLFFYPGDVTTPQICDYFHRVMLPLLQLVSFSRNDRGHNFLLGSKRRRRYLFIDASVELEGLHIPPPPETHPLTFFSPPRPFLFIPFRLSQTVKCCGFDILLSLNQINNYAGIVAYVRISLYLEERTTCKLQ